MMKFCVSHRDVAMSELEQEMKQLQQQELEKPTVKTLPTTSAAADEEMCRVQKASADERWNLLEE